MLNVEIFWNHENENDIYNQQDWLKVNTSQSFELCAAIWLFDRMKFETMNFKLDKVFVIEMNYESLSEFESAHMVATLLLNLMLEDRYAWSYSTDNIVFKIN